MKQRLLILGGSGMLGHKVTQLASAQMETYCTLREKGLAQKFPQVFGSAQCIEGISAKNFELVAKAFAQAKPTTVVNCIGVVKQIGSAADTIANIEINALLPHRLFELCQTTGARLVHLSTDCVFSGRTGQYQETDATDANDLYGRSKLLGELDHTGSLTVRTSMIGRQLGKSYSLLEWFLSQNHKKVSGYKKAIFSGLPTHALAETLLRIVLEFPNLSGIYHLAANPISKFDLLSLIKDCFGLDIEIQPDESLVIDRSLNDQRFRKATGIPKVDWPTMIAELHKDPTVGYCPVASSTPVTLS